MDIFHAFIIISCYIIMGSCMKYDRKDGKLLLNPVELVDLITEEKQKTGLAAAHYRTHDFTDHTIRILPLEETTTTEQECRDLETLRSRKVWSRWSKWGECSVTCGAGAILRQRTCVAGRCARGEREEQRRPCVRAPCLLEGPPDDFRDGD